MKTFTSTNDYGKMPETVRDHIQSVLPTEQGTFDSLLGGDVHVLDTLEELIEIPVDITEGRTAADTVGPLDDARLLGDYGVFFLVTNDAGGNVYFTPKWMVDNCVILQAIITATAAQSHS